MKNKEQQYTDVTMPHNENQCIRLHTISCMQEENA